MPLTIAKCSALRKVHSVHWFLTEGAPVLVPALLFHSYQLNWKCPQWLNHLRPARVEAQKWFLVFSIRYHQAWRTRLQERWMLHPNRVSPQKRLPNWYRWMIYLRLFGYRLLVWMTIRQVS